MTNTTPSLFASVRSSRDISLVAFGAAILVAFALHAGAFLPKLSSAEASETAAAPVSIPAAVVASR